MRRISPRALLAIPLIVLSLGAVRATAEVAWTETAKLVASDPGVNDQFGDDVAIDGVRLVVGAHRDDAPFSGSGSVYVFERDPSSGEWVEVAKLLPADLGVDWFLGSEVSVSSDTVAATAPFAHDQEGAAYLFEPDPLTGEWAEVAKLTAPDGPGQQWGSSIAVDGDRLVVGEAFDDQAGLDAGAVYVFERDVGGPGAWGPVAKLTASDATSNDRFGDRVEVQGDRIVVGADEANGVSSQTGAAYVFERDAGGQWVEVAKLFASDGNGADHFADALGLDGDRVVVGAKNDDDLGNSSGAAYVFERDPGGKWIEVAKLLPSDGTIGDEFGTSVDISGGSVVASAECDSDPFAGTGSAYVFERNTDGNWIEVAKLLASDRDGFEATGRSVSIDGTTVAAGSPLEDSAGFDAGAAYVFTRISPELTLTGTCPGEVTLALTGATPGGPVAFLWSAEPGSVVLPEPCAGTELGLADPRLLAVRAADGHGEISATRTVGSGACGLLVQALDGASCLASERRGPLSLALAPTDLATYRTGARPTARGPVCQIRDGQLAFA